MTKQDLRLIFTFLFLLLFSISGCKKEEKIVNPSGTLETVQTDVSSTIAGRALSVKYQLGDQVKSGDTLLIIDTELLRLQRKQTETNRRSILAQRKVLRSSILQAERNVEWLETTIKRVISLVESGSTTQQQLDDLAAKRDIAKLQLLNARDQYAVLDAEDAKLEAGLAVLDRQLQEAIITSPLSGNILMRNIEPGEIVQPGRVLLRIADLTDMELRIFLDEIDLDKVKIGLQLPVLIDAFEGKSVNGRVAWISAEAEFTPKNAQTRDARVQLVYAVKLRIANQDMKFHIGMPAEVILP